MVEDVLWSVTPSRRSQRGWNFRKTRDQGSSLAVRLNSLCRILQSLLELDLEDLHHGLFNHDVLVVKHLDDVVVIVLIVNADDDRLDGRVTLDEDA